MSFPDSNDSDTQYNEEELNTQKEHVLKQILTADARSRLANIKMVKPELATMIENYLIGMATQGRLPHSINDDQLKQILLSMQQPKHDFKINRL